MSKHSIKVPKLYKCASNLAIKYAAGEGSIKNLLYQIRHPNKKAILALVVRTFQHIDKIDYLIERSELLTKEPGLIPWLAKVLIAEVFWGKQQLSDESKPVQTILAYKDKFTEYLSEYKNRSYNNVPPPKQVSKPRYVRINTLKVQQEDVITALQNEGWKFLRKSSDTYEEFLSRVSNLQKDEFMLDYNIPNMLVFEEKTQFHKTEVYKKGEIVLQDKASCLTVHLLDPKPGSCVLDMCAAPGMKTTLLASLMENTGKIYAVDSDRQRFETMNKLIRKIGANCVQTMCRDVLTVGDEACPNVEYILVDPSCSGSGIINREFINEQPNQNRLEKLSKFQTMILRHALRRFPKARRVIYSTCSVHEEENEAVVWNVIQTSADFKLVNLKELLQDKWINFGLPEYGDIGERCLRAVPEVDHTNGFFIAMFERLEENETNEFFIDRFATVQNTNQIDVSYQNGKTNSYNGGNNGNGVFNQKYAKKKSILNNKDSQNSGFFVLSDKGRKSRSLLNKKTSLSVTKKKKSSITGLLNKVKSRKFKANHKNSVEVKGSTTKLEKNTNEKKSPLKKKTSLSVTKKKKINKRGKLKANNKDSVKVEGSLTKVGNDKNEKIETSPKSEETGRKRKSHWLFFEEEAFEPAKKYIAEESTETKDESNSSALKSNGIKLKKKKKTKGGIKLIKNSK